jgi:hypothetical protein
MHTDGGEGPALGGLALPSRGRLDEFDRVLGHLAQVVVDHRRIPSAVFSRDDVETVVGEVLAQAPHLGVGAFLLREFPTHLEGAHGRNCSSGRPSELRLPKTSAPG